MYEVIYYETKEGRVPFCEHLDRLPPRLAAKVLRGVSLLEIEGPALREPDTKPLGRGLFELRIQLGSDAERAFFFFVEGARIVVTHAITKRSQRTPRREIERARGMRADWLARYGGGAERDGDV